MKQIPNSSNQYDENLFLIDEQICALLKQRKDLSNKNTFIPPDDAISSWAAKYDLYEDYLKALFGTLGMEKYFKPKIEPKGFRKHLLVLKSIEFGNRLYSVTAIRQYENASVVQLHIDWDGTNDSPTDLQHQNFELFIGEKYDCRQDRGSGSTGHFTYDYVVSPPLPDDISGLDLIFKEYSDHFLGKPTGLEIVISIE